MAIFLEYPDFAAYGLGRGVDGSDPHPMNNTQYYVRNVLPLKNPRNVLPENLQQTKRDKTSIIDEVISYDEKAYFLCWVLCF